MQIQGRVAIVTGGASAIGRALSRKLASEGAGAVIVADIDRESGIELSKEINGFFVPYNPIREADVQMLVEAAVAQTGRVDMFCSCDCLQLGAEVEPSNKQWQRSWDCNVMALVYAARAVLPQMLERKEGYWLQALPVPGMNGGAAADAVAGYAGLGFASWLAARYADRGIRVSAFAGCGLCKPGLRIEFESPKASAMAPDRLASNVIEAVKAEKFLLARHPQKTVRTSKRRR